MVKDSSAREPGFKHDMSEVSLSKTQSQLRVLCFYLKMCFQV